MADTREARKEKKKVECGGEERKMHRCRRRRNRNVSKGFLVRMSSVKLEVEEMKQDLLILSAGEWMDGKECKRSDLREE